MKITHVSDTHGALWRPDTQGEVIVHSGDMMPNRTRGIVPIEVAYQECWTTGNLPTLARVIGSRPFLYVPGNHDYYDPCPRMREAGINAWNLNGVGLHFGTASCTAGLRFAGFQYVPYFTGEWNYEVSATEMAARFDPVVALHPDILVCHSPIYGVLDRNVEGERCGSTVIRNRMMSLFHDGPGLPKAYLHGHIHERGGSFQDWNGMLVSNAATTVREIVIRT